MHTHKHIYIHVMNMLKEVDHMHEIIIGFYRKEHPGIKEVLLEISNMRAKI